MATLTIIVLADEYPYFRSLTIKKTYSNNCVQNLSRNGQEYYAAACSPIGPAGGGVRAGGGGGRCLLTRLHRRLHGWALRTRGSHR